MSKKIGNQVRELLAQGKSNEYIARVLNLKSPQSVAGYKAVFKRQEHKNQSNPCDALNQYSNSNYVVLPIEDIKSKLDEKQITRFVDMLSLILDSEEAVKKRKRSDNNGNLERELKPLSPSEVRNIILECKRNGIPNKDIYNDLQLAGVGRYTIRAYIAHCHPNMSYAKRGLMD